MAKGLNGKELPKGVIQLPSGLYRTEFMFKGDRYSVTADTIAQLKKKVTDKKYEVAHGLYSNQTNATLDEWYPVWIKEYKSKRVKETTIVVYNDCYNAYVKKKLGHKKLKDISPHMIQLLYNELEQKGFARSTLERVRAVLSGSLGQAYKNEMIVNNPVDRTTLPNNDKHKEARVMTDREEMLFLQYAKSSWLYNLMVVALNTGMRSGELRGLEWSDVDFENRIIHVTGTLIYFNHGGYYKGSPKTRTSKRDIPMTNLVYDTLKATQKKQNRYKELYKNEYHTYDGLEDLVFTAYDGFPVNRDRLKVQINSIVQEINNDNIEFERITPHTFRHTFATKCIRRNMSPQILQKILGHHKLEMTMDLYVHNNNDDKLKAMRKCFDD